MKYIRTKDGRIINLERKGLYNLPVYNFDTKENVLKAHRNQEDRNCCCIDNDIFYDYCYEDGTLWEYEIVKQADTIEELCDEFVLTWACQKRLHNTLQEAKYWHSHLRKEIKHLGIVYGAIWTDKGLIFVARMNEKGELELL